MERDYTVTGMRPTTDIDALGNIVPVIEVTYQGHGNLVDKVKIPEASYTPQNVDAVIRARLAAHNAVYGLGEAK